MKLEAAILCLYGSNGVLILSLRDVINGCKLQQKQTFNLVSNHLVLIVANGVFLASSFEKVFR